MTTEEVQTVFSLICNKNQCDTCIVGGEADICFRELTADDGDFVVALIPKLMGQYESKYIRNFLSGFVKAEVV